jgi:hypothetical protein
MPIQFKLPALVCVALLAAVALCPPAIHAATIGNLYNTGVDPFATPLIGTGTLDPHYSLIVSPTAATAVTVNDPGYPIGVWFPNSATSRWIGPAGNSIGAGGNYIYRTSFTLPANALLNTVNISGLWGVDDVLTDVLINGNSTGPVTPFYTPLTPFTLPTGFYQIGGNNLDFVVLNANIGANPTGLRIDGIKGTFQVPELSTACLAATGLLCCVAIRRRWQSKHATEARMT